MNTIPSFAVLEFSDFAIIAVLILIFGGVGLVRQRVDLLRVERKLDTLLKHQGAPIPPHISDEVQRMLSDPAKRTEAIKLHRQQAGLNEEEAMVDIDGYLEAGKNNRA